MNVEEIFFKYFAEKKFLCVWRGPLLALPTHYDFFCIFTNPMGRVGLVVAMCVCFSVCPWVSLMSPFHVIFLRGWTGADHASSVDWCNLDFDLDLDLDLE